MSRDDVQRWKDKYLENIEQQERLQRRWDAGSTCCVAAWCVAVWRPKAATRRSTSA